MNIKGVGIGRGVAVGPVIRMAAPLPEPSDAPRAENISAETEIARVEKSLALVNADLNRRAEEAANGDEGAKQAAPILQAIAMFASDPSLAQSIKDLINQGKTAERAVLEGFGAVEDMFRAIGGYQAERAADLHDVGQRVIADLMGAPAPGLPVSETPFVLVAEDLSPADTAALDMSKTLAIVTSQGGPTSHTAILARARGIVAVVSAAEAAEETFENVADITETAKSTETAGSCTGSAAVIRVYAGMTELVVPCTFLGVRQHFIRFVDFLEFFFCIFIPGILVRMVFYCHLTVSLFQLRICGILLYAQYLIIISFICQLTHHLAGDLPLCYLNSKAGCPALSVGTLAFCLFLSIRFLSRHRLLHRSRRPVQLRPVQPVPADTAFRKACRIPASGFLLQPLHFLYLYLSLLGYLTI